MEQQEFEALRKRLDRVERRLRVAVVGWVVSIATVAVLVVVQQVVPQPEPEVLRARRIEVVDAAGRARIVLDTAPSGSPVLILLDAAGRGRIALDVSPGGTQMLIFWDAAGRARIGLRVGPDGTPTLGLYDAADRVLFEVP
ncbi:MAG: hypothetical protein FJX74_19575 [Armatimonadetes bacterium]|nr:hypothetical protein [Armatimonadota bacterium]